MEFTEAGANVLILGGGTNAALRLALPNFGFKYDAPNTVVHDHVNFNENHNRVIGRLRAVTSIVSGDAEVNQPFVFKGHG